MGVIIDGKYYADRSPEKQEVSTSISSISESNQLNRVYEDHAHNLIQPYNQDGTPNQDYIDYYPEDAKNYGFIEEDQDANV